MDSLSIYLQASFLCDWCSLVEIVRLDTAECSRNSRQQFLKLLSSDVFSVKSNHQLSTQKSLNWIALRKVKMRHCFICRDCVNFSLDLDISKINSLEFKDCKVTEAAIVEIINTCSNVSSVVIYHKQLTLQNLAHKLERLSEFDHCVVWGKYARVGFLPGPPDLIFPADLSSDMWSKCNVALEFPDDDDDILLSSFYRKDSKLFNFNDILRQISTFYSSTLKYVEIYLYTPNSIDLNVLVDFCVKCARLKSIFESHNENGGDAAFSLIHDGGCDQLELHCSPSCILYTELNMMSLFERLKDFSTIRLFDFPLLTNDILSQIIKGSPRCMFREIQNCGKHYDQSLVSVKR